MDGSANVTKHERHQTRRFGDMRKSWTVGALVAVGVLLGATGCNHGAARHVKSETIFERGPGTQTLIADS
jgi:hypothetical protein